MNKTLKYVLGGFAALAFAVAIKNYKPEVEPLDITPTENPTYQYPKAVLDQHSNFQCDCLRINVAETNKNRYISFIDYGFQGKLRAVEVHSWNGTREVMIINEIELANWTNSFNIARKKATSDYGLSRLVK